MLISLLSASLALAAPISGVSTTYLSPNGLVEECVKTLRMPGAIYLPKDEEAENKLCQANIYDNSVGVCPKTWSTSAGTMIYSAKGSNLTQEQLEASPLCGKKENPFKKIGKFKVSINKSGTSATFAQSSLLYYHFSRYFSSLVTVPQAVYRSFDKDSHYARVASKAVGAGSMNKVAWEYLRNAEKNPSSYVPTRDIFTPDLKQIYGIMLNDGGERYGAVINGARSAWGEPQNNDFQQTPAYLALRSNAALSQAIKVGAVSRNAAVAKDLGNTQISDIQMIVWMKELTEITLLDYIFNQQDRIGNIDYSWYWVYQAEGKVKAEKENRDQFKKELRANMGKIPVPAELKDKNPVLIQKSSIGDNDAGGRPTYVNYTKRTQMLEKIRHYDAAIYRKLVKLNKDFQSKGPAFQHLNTLYLTEKEIASIVSNTNAATKIFQESCLRGELRFDLNYEQFILTGSSTEERLDCLNP